MTIATLSSKFQIGIPKQIREELHLKAGQKFIFIAKGDMIYLVPQRDIAELKGIMANTDISNVRDRKERT
jgi:AbrB family looped-hinge helix DNA binding protein